MAGSKGKHICDLARYSYTLLGVDEMCLFPHSFAVKGVELLKFGVHYLKFHVSLPFFPSRLRTYRLHYL